MNDWPADPKLDASLRRMVEAELAAAKTEGAVPLRVVSRRVRRTRMFSSLGVAAGGAVVLVIVAALVLRGTITGPGTGADTEPSSSPSAAESASPSVSSPAASEAATQPAESTAPSPSLASLPPGAGKFVPTGSPIGNLGPEVRLADGRVLFIDNPGAEIYDPATGKFASAGGPAAIHPDGTATLLADGRVLLAGGYDTTAPNPDVESNRAELFDPSTGKFTKTGSMTMGRSGHTATLLADGRVLMAGGGIQHVGGQDTSGTGDVRHANWFADVRRETVDPRIARPTATLEMTATAELYDPKTGTFHATGSMTIPRDQATATRLEDGRVLIAGAGDEGNAADASADLYDPTTGKFSATGSMNTARYGQTATLLPDGRVLISGGTDGQGPLVSLEAYDPAKGRFDDAGSNETREGPFVVVLQDGRVLMVGGNTLSNAKLWTLVRECGFFDIATDKASPAASLSAKGDAYVEAAVPLLDGRVLVVEISRTDTTQTTTAELFVP